MKQVAYIYSIVATALLVWLLIEYRDARNIEPTVITDLRIDTVAVEKPVIEREYILRVDTCYLTTVDTVRVSDTVRVLVPIEQKEYKDSSYYAIVSGYNPRLDYIEIYPRTITNTVIRGADIRKDTPFSVHLGAGIAATPKGLQPAVTLSIGIDLYRFKQKK